MYEPNLKMIPVSEIREHADGLRSVDRDSEQYHYLASNIAHHGLLNPISVRWLEPQDEEDAEGHYSIVDGLQRYSACVDAGFSEIPCNVVNLDDIETYKAQLFGNVQRVDTPPTAISKQLQKLIASDPSVTIPSMAAQLDRSVAWVKQYLSLKNLSDSIQEVLDDGRIQIANASALAKLPPEEQLAMLHDAMTMQPAEFVPKATDRKKELDKARREGRAASEQEFKAHSVLRKMSEIKEELDTGHLCTEILEASKAKTAEEGFREGLRFCLKLDAVTVARAEAEHNAKIESRKQKQEDAKMERRKKQAARKLRQGERNKLHAELIENGASEEETAEQLAAFDAETKAMHDEE